MKKIVLFLSLLLPVLSYAQNYNPLQFGPKTYFTNSNGYLRGMRIDSVGAVGADSVYYPFHTTRMAGYLRGYCTIPFAKDTAGGSWLGKKVIKQADGTWLFDNIWHDTVVIRSQAAIGDTWRFFDDATNIGYNATVTSIDTMTIAGEQDSVKTILISADTAGIPRTTDPVNGVTLKLSCNHGFVQAIDLYTFPYHLPDSLSDIIFIDFYLDYITGRCFTFGDVPPPVARGAVPDTSNMLFRQVAFQNPTMKSIYNFADGDVYERYYHSYNTTTYLMVYKYNMDTVFGTVSTPYSTSYNTYAHCTQLYSSVLPPSYDTFHVVEPGGGIYDTTTLIDQYIMPEETGSNYYYFYLPEDSIVDASCPIKGKFIRRLKNISYLNDTLDLRYSMGPDFNYHYLTILDSVYYPGYGLWAMNYSDANETRNLEYTYIYKGGVVCYGAFRWLVGVNNVNGGIAEVDLRPNPAADMVTVKTNSSTRHRIRVMNMLGQSLWATDSDSPEDNISLRNIPNGIYNVIISDINGTSRISKKLVIAH